MDQIQLVDKAVSEDRIIEFFKSIVRIPSPRFKEEAVARHIGTFMNGMGLKVSFHTVRQADTETIQVVGRYGQNKGGKRVALCAHMDTGSGQYQGLVFQPDRWTKDPLDPVVEDGFIYGLGTHNNKQGIACAVMAVDAIVKSGVSVDGELIVACVAAETVAGVGAGRLIEEGFEADAAVVTEGTGLDVVPVSVGKIRGRILVKGEHKHHSQHTSPIESLRHLIDAFSPGYGDNIAKQSFRSAEADPDLPGLPSGAIRWVRSDETDLDQVAAYFDIMVLPDQTPDTVQHDLQHLISVIKHQHPEFDAEVDMRGWEPPLSENFIWGAGATDLDADIVTAVARHHEAVRQEKPIIGAGRRFGAASDAASFRRAGIPTIEYGPGSIGPDGDLPVWPAVDERVRVGDVVDCTRVIARASFELVNESRA